MILSPFCGTLLKDADERKAEAMRRIRLTATEHANLITPSSDYRTEHERQGWLTEAGLEVIERDVLASGLGVMVARKP